MTTKEQDIQVEELKRILVPVDYSDYSSLACRYAAKVAKKTGAELRIFHSFYSPVYDLIELTGNRQSQAQLREDVTKKLMTTETEKISVFVEQLKEFKEVSGLKDDQLLYELRPGLPKDEIFDIAKTYQPDLVVMGTRGKDKKVNSLFGSVTEIMITKLKFPVLAIPEEYEFIGEQNLKKIVYLTDFDESDFVSIQKLMKFTKPLGLTIHCIHIGSEADNWKIIRMNGLKDYFKSAYHHNLVECTVLEKSNTLIQDLDDYIRVNGINLISLTTYRKNLIEKLFKGNLTKRLFYHTSMPLLVFHS